MQYNQLIEALRALIQTNPTNLIFAAVLAVIGLVVTIWNTRGSR